MLPGSHRVEPEQYKELLARNGIDNMADAAAAAADPSRPHLPAAAAKEFGLAPHSFSASPGSMVFLNARCYHGVAAQRPDSPQAHRGFLNVRPHPALSTCTPRIWILCTWRSFF